MYCIKPTFKYIYLYLQNELEEERQKAEVLLVETPEIKSTIT